MWSSDLRVALEHVRVALRRRQRLDQRRQHAALEHARASSRTRSRSGRRGRRCSPSRSAARIWSTKSLTICACWCRWTSLDRVGGWKRPNSGSSPPFELKWLATTNSRLPWYMNSAASGLRLSLNAGFVGSIRPGLNVSCGPLVGRHDGGWPSSTSPPGRSTNSRSASRSGRGSRRGCCRPARRRPGC